MISLKEISYLNSFVSATDKLLNFVFYPSVDNRELDFECIYIAIVGERYNPLKHLDKVKESGCKFVVYEESEESNELIKPFEKDIVFIKVNNIINFIQDTAKIIAAKFKQQEGKIIAISGSNGKTTTKEMLYHLLAQTEGEESVICTQKNNNNHLGVPFTLFQIREQTKYAIIELGSNHPGEIEFLCKIIKPQLGVTTNIGETHLEFFKTKENVYLEEGILNKYCSQAFFINMDDDYLSRLKDLDKGIGFGFCSDENKFQYGIQNITIGSSIIKNSSITGKHNFINLGVAFLIGLELGLSEEALRFAAEGFKPTKNRSEWINRGDTKVFLDAYNANPSSMKVALEAFSEHIGSIGADLTKCCVILGDMNELGDNELEHHLNLGKLVNEMNLGAVYFVGRFAAEFLKGCEKAKTYKDTKLLKEENPTLLTQHKFFFIKASRSLQLETILDIK